MGNQFSVGSDKDWMEQHLRGCCYVAVFVVLHLDVFALVCCGLLIISTSVCSPNVSKINPAVRWSRLARMKG
ncbi:hypothetical protein O3P69_003498 [Scylla paramamosain]|uniref:Uncharacterized protein n=1 Tax=Scylla paramamosain TaxID=85552 RepID=A0AAW0UH36_SCYPA